MPTLRVVSGSYEHNLLCVAFTFDEKAEVFTPIFHFTPHTQSIRCLAWSKKVLASGSNDEWIRLYDLQRRKELGTLMHHQGQILCIQFVGNKWFLSGAGDGRICLWRVKDWELLAELKAHKAPVLDMSVHDSGRIMLSVGVDRKLVLWNLMTARKAAIRKLKEAPVQVSFVPESENGSDYIIGYNQKVVLYTSNGKEARSWPFTSRIHRCGWAIVKGVRYLVVSTEDGKLSFCNIIEEQVAFELQGHAARVKDFSVLDHYMASASTDGNIVIWDLETRKQIGVYNSGDRLNCVVLLPDEVEKLKSKQHEAEAIDIGTISSENEEEDQIVKPASPKTRKKSKVIVIHE